MLAMRSVRALARGPGCAGKATAAAQPRLDRRIEEDAGRAGHAAVDAAEGDAAAAKRSTEHQELLSQLQEHEVRIPVPWGHVAGKWWGRRDRRPLLALHGWGDNAGSFERLAGSLRGVPLLALDLPGHGLSSRPPRGPHPADLLLGTLRRVHRALGVTSLSLVGHSLGDAVALLYAATFPTDVDLYVSLDPLSPSPVDADGQVKSMGAALDELLDAEDVLDQQSSSSNGVTKAQLVHKLIAGRGGSLNRHAAETLLRRGAQGEEGRLSLTLDPRVSRTAVLSASLALAAARAVRCPTLAVIPEWRGPRALTADPELRDRLLADLRMAAKSLTAVTVTGTHHVHLNSPEVVMPALNDFLEMHRRPQGAEERVDIDRFTV